MSLINNITDLSGMDFQVDTASDANEMAKTPEVSKYFNSDSNGFFDDGILDIGADEIKPIQDTEEEEDDPNIPDEYQPVETENIKLGDFDEVLLIEMQQQEEENAMIKGYPMPKH